MFLHNKDYVVFKVRYYASEYILNKHGPSHKQHWDRARFGVEFFWKLYEFVTKKSSSTFMTEHMLYAQESACEELEYDYGGIMRHSREGDYYYLIPINNTALIEWMHDNIFPLPYKILRKAKLGYHSTQDDTMYWRNTARKFTEEQKQKQFERENTRNVLIEKHKNGNSGK